MPQLFGGSADLAPSNKTEMKDEKVFSSKADYSGRNVHFGVREMAMGAITDGLALHGGVRPYAGTFFVFSDYMKPMIRLAALMSLPTTYVLTHDSIGVGEDGPTHEPIEQLAMLRSLPNVNVFRPADATETAAGWYLAATSQKTPTALRPDSSEPAAARRQQQRSLERGLRHRRCQESRSRCHHHGQWFGSRTGRQRQRRTG